MIKLSKQQEDFLNICWSMKVVNIVPQAAKLGIPEDEVRKYLATKGLSIDQDGFVFQGKARRKTGQKPKEGMIKDKVLAKKAQQYGLKISDADFRAVMTEACRQHEEAYKHWERVEWINRDQTNEKDRKEVRDASEAMRTAEAVIRTVLKTMSGIDPNPKCWPHIERLRADAAREGGINVQGA